MTTNYLSNLKPSRLGHKKLVFVLTQGNPDEALFADIYPRYHGFLKWMGFTDTRLIRACGIGPSSIVDAVPEKVLQQAEAARALDSLKVSPERRSEALYSPYPYGPA